MTGTSKINFSKLSGAGNDFIVIDGDEEKSLEVNPALIKKLCHRRNGIGADGLIIVKKIDDADFTMHYFNADGSTGSLCGNGARCAIKFAHLTGKFSSSQTRFISNGEMFSGEVVNSEIVKFYLNPSKKIKFNFKIKIFGQLINACYADTGSPHVVIKICDVLEDVSQHKSFYTLEEFPVLELGKAIRYHNDFMPSGTNVNFIEIKENEIFIRTYERGVEDETLACGTGSTAAAIVASVTDNLKPPIKLITRGGDMLSVDFKYEKNNFYNLSLTGPAKVIFTGSFLLNSYS